MANLFKLAFSPWSGSDRAPASNRTGSGAPVRDVQWYLQDAHNLLCWAKRRGVPVPHDVTSIVIEGRRTYEQGEKLDTAQEIRFWGAYGVLRSAIEPTYRARQWSRHVFYFSLFLMLLVQLYYLLAASALDRITSLDGKYDVLEAPAYATFAMLVVPGIVASGEPKAQLPLLLPILEVLMDFLAAYVLPALYGLLGACAFVLRHVSDGNGHLRSAGDIKGQYTLRLNIGLLAGLAVGWFIKPEDSSIIASLSPLAIAFVAGYGSELLFAVLDRIVQAFTTPQGDSAKVNEEGAGGLKGIEERRTRARTTEGPEHAVKAT